MAGYFLVSTGFVWAFYALFVYKDPEGKLTDDQQYLYLTVGIPKLLFEMLVLVVFICLIKSFNALSQDYQLEQRSAQSNFVRIAKILSAIVCFLYFVNVVLYNVVSPMFWHF